MTITTPKEAEERGYIWVANIPKKQEDQFASDLKPRVDRVRFLSFDKEGKAVTLPWVALWVDPWGVARCRCQEQKKGACEHDLAELKKLMSRIAF